MALLNRPHFKRGRQHHYHYGHKGHNGGDDDDDDTPGADDSGYSICTYSKTYAYPDSRSRCKLGDL